MMYCYLLIISSFFSLYEEQNNVRNRFLSVPISMNQETDSIKPVEIITTEKMNIMIDVQKELIALQWKGLNRQDRNIVLADSSGKMYEQKPMYAGSTIVYFETQTLYSGNYILKISDQNDWILQKISVIKPE